MKPNCAQCRYAECHYAKCCGADVFNSTATVLSDVRDSFKSLLFVIKLKINKSYPLAISRACTINLHGRNTFRTAVS